MENGQTDRTHGINDSYLYNIINTHTHTDECLNVEQIYRRSISRTGQHFIKVSRTAAPRGYVPALQRRRQDVHTCGDETNMIIVICTGDNPSPRPSFTSQYLHSNTECNIIYRIHYTIQSDGNLTFPQSTIIFSRLEHIQNIEKKIPNILAI